MVRTVFRKRQGQISIDYIAGALVFFGAIIVLVSSILNTIPAFQNTHAVNELEMSGWGLSEVVMNDPGYWENATGNGTDWHEADNTDVQVIGLQTANRNGLSIQKIQALQDMEYTTVKEKLNMEHDFSVSFITFLHIDTYRTLKDSDIASRISEPTYPSGTADEKHYGTTTVDGTEYYFLRADSTGWYNNLWISTDWKFDDKDTTTRYNLSEENVVTMDGKAYVVNIGDTQVGNGNVLIMERRTGRAGAIPPENVNNVIETTRAGVTDGNNRNIVKAVFQVW